MHSLNLEAENLLYVGCCTHWLPWMDGSATEAQMGKGICICRLNANNGELTLINIFSEIINPNFLALSHNRLYLYAVIETETFNGEIGGGVAAFKINSQTGALTLLNQHATGGLDPCHVSIDKEDRCLIVSNYTGGSVAVFKLASDGSILKRSQFIQYQESSLHSRQANSHAHSAIFSHDNRYVFIQNFGGDTIHQYSIDTTIGKLTENNIAIIKTKPSTGPRFFIFHPKKPYAYVLNELDNSIHMYDYMHEQGVITERQCITTLPVNFYGENTAAHMQITMDGRFLYASNRGHDSLAIFFINQQTGFLHSLGHQPTLGKVPRNFFITPDDRWLLCANQNSDTIVSFAIDNNTGELIQHKKSLQIAKPVCIQMAT